MNSLEECNISITNMVNDTFTILQRPDRVQKQLIKEFWIGFGIELNQINSETVKILKDNSWRDKS